MEGCNPVMRYYWHVTAHGQSTGTSALPVMITRNDKMEPTTHLIPSQQLSACLLGAINPLSQVQPFPPFIAVKDLLGPLHLEIQSTNSGKHT